MIPTPQDDPTPAELDWQGDIPVSRRFDDPYFSLAGGWPRPTTSFCGATVWPSGSATVSGLPSWVSEPA
jgi:hypothetical protein